MSATDATSVRSRSTSVRSGSVLLAKSSLSKRFSSILSGAKASNVNKFAIELDNEHKTYGPGETVSGTVVLDVARPLGVTHITVCLYGNVEAFRGHARPRQNETGRAATGRGKRWVSEYYGDGFVSLFEEEIVLCGQGCLEPKLYHFKFDIDFPQVLDLPSSITFERGSISYNVKAIVTRPAAIGATMHVERKVSFKEDINIALLPSPKPREATLHPVTREYHSRTSLRLHPSPGTRSFDNVKPPSLIRTDRTLPPDGATRNSSLSVGAHDGPLTGTASSRSSSISFANPDNANSSTRSTGTTDGSPRPVQSIHTLLKLVKSGCLAGQMVYVHVKISNHYKMLKNPRGIVVTLYRLARVDMHPNLPLSKGTAGKDAYEDYYPRSRTGLGGISLSSAGSSGVWRKDLSQTTSPLYINPLTMSAELKVGVKVPDEAFPSIRNVPGEMISFMYYIEVIIDIQGKLYLENVPSKGGISTVAQESLDGRNSNGFGGQLQTMVFGSDCFDTTHLRRDKHAVVLECDLTVGTRDYVSNKGKAAVVEAAIQSYPGVPEQDDGRATDVEYNGPGHDPNQPNGTAGDEHESWWYDGHGYYQYEDGSMVYGPYHAHEYAEEEYHEDYGDGYGDDGHWHDTDYHNHPPYWQYPVEGYGRPHPQAGQRAPIPVPRPPDEPGLSEKERLRRHEASLLPSQPPVEDGPSTILPTAPNLAEEANPYPEANSQPHHDASIADPALARNELELGGTADQTTPTPTFAPSYSGTDGPVSTMTMTMPPRAVRSSSSQIQNGVDLGESGVTLPADGAPAGNEATSPAMGEIGSSERGRTHEALPAYER